MDEKKRKCGIYIRVSTPEQAREGESLDEQITTIEKFCEFKNFNHRRVYREEGKSAKDTNRPEFQKLLFDIESGRVNTVIVKKIDRFSRSIIDFENTYKIFEKHDVDFISLQENFDTTIAIGRAALRIVLIFAQLEREQTGERIRDVLEYKARQGLPPRGGHLIIGYNIDSESKRLVPVEDEIPIVREIFDTYLQTSSTAETANAMNERGYRTKAWVTPAGKNMGGKRFDKKHITRMIQNPAYIGKIFHNGSVFEGLHDGIVDVDTFNAVQEMVRANEVNKNSLREESSGFLLKGIIFCGHCKRAMSPYSVKNTKTRKDGSKHIRRHRYYKCQTDIDKSRGKCPVGSINIKQIEKLIIEEIRSLSKNEKVVKELVEEATNDARNRIVPKRREQQSLRARLKKAEDESRNLIDAVAQGLKGKQLGVLLKRLEEYDELINNLKEQIEQIEYEIYDLETKVISAEFVVENFKKFDEVYDSLTFQQKFDLIHLLIKKIVYKEDKPKKKDDKKTRTGSVRIEFFQLLGDSSPVKKKSPGQFRVMSRGTVSGEGSPRWHLKNNVYTEFFQSFHYSKSNVSAVSD